MEEIKVGEYVRTDYGISKVVPKINAWITNEQVTLDLYNGIRNISIFKNIVKKHSSNIIDLIEEGDYVNGEKVLYIDKCLYGGEKVIITELNHSIFDNMIDDIVTKEMFNQVKYEV